MDTRKLDILITAFAKGELKKGTVKNCVIAALLRDAGAPQELLSSWHRLVFSEPLRDSWVALSDLQATLQMSLEEIRNLSLSFEKGGIDEAVSYLLKEKEEKEWILA